MYKRLGIVIAILNFLAVLNSTYFFLGMAKASLIEWLFFNACAPSVLLYFIGYLTKNKIIQAMAIPALAFFGIGGMFVFGWRGSALFAQVGHLFMTSAVVWLVYAIFKNKSFKEATIGFILASFLVNGFITIDQRYTYRHWERFQKIMEYNPNGSLPAGSIMPAQDGQVK
ncbi:MAG: hypothetical protein WC901_05540 [Candidatus Margulisiibacteriota bacterium]